MENTQNIFYRREIVMQVYFWEKFFWMQLMPLNDKEKAAQVCVRNSSGLYGQSVWMDGQNVHVWIFGARFYGPVRTWVWSPDSGLKKFLLLVIESVQLTKFLFCINNLFELYWYTEHIKRTHIVIRHTNKLVRWVDFLFLYFISNGKNMLNFINGRRLF